MIGLVMNLQGDGCWPDLRDNPKVVHVENGKPIQVAALPGGMVSGRPSVSIRIDLADGTIVVAETSARLFLFAARALKARYPELEE